MLRDAAQSFLPRSLFNAAFSAEFLSDVNFLSAWKWEGLIVSECDHLSEIQLLTGRLLR